MCGIAGQISLTLESTPGARRSLEVMSELIRHRGPDGDSLWVHSSLGVGFAHRRLSIIDAERGSQPMQSPSSQNVLVFNGEIYNYLELRKELEGFYSFRTESDTEVILAAYERWGEACVDHLRGMFAFALWDEKNKTMFCARDRFGIKPFYYYLDSAQFWFASEPKALLPFIDELKVSEQGLQDYFSFQLCLHEKTLFEGISQLEPGHIMVMKGGDLRTKRYWEPIYEIDWTNSRSFFEEQLRSLLEDSVKLHLRSDVPVGAYVSGGLDSSALAALASQRGGKGSPFRVFNGRFEGAEYDESSYAKALASMYQMDFHDVLLTEQDFVSSMKNIIYHLDYPVAGPGSFPQFHVSKLASENVKVVLGGQGGDEIFGGYVRYLIGYFEQCIKGAIEGTLNSGNFVVTYESIIPNLVALEPYKPLLKEFFKEGLFDPLDARYFRLVNRASGLEGLVNWEDFKAYSPFESFKRIFHGKNVGKESYFDKMTHFDFKTLLPSLLHVEDRMSMAHGLEARVPLLDHPLVEFAAKMPADIKFKDGNLKMIFKDVVKNLLPPQIVNRTDKKGFPVPFGDWLGNGGLVKDFVYAQFDTAAARSRPFIRGKKVLERLDCESRFGRSIWGLLSLELWFQNFFDEHHKYRSLIRD